MFGGREGNVIDLRVVAPERAAGDRELEFAWQVVKGVVGAESLGDAERERRGIYELMTVEAGERAAGDVANDVAAGALRERPISVRMPTTSTRSLMVSQWS